MNVSQTATVSQTVAAARCGVPRRRVFRLIQCGAVRTFGGSPRARGPGAPRVRLADVKRALARPDRRGRKRDVSDSRKSTLRGLVSWPDVATARRSLGVIAAAAAGGACVDLVAAAIRFLRDHDGGFVSALLAPAAPAASDTLARGPLATFAAAQIRHHADGAAVDRAASGRVLLARLARHIMRGPRLVDVDAALDTPLAFLHVPVWIQTWRAHHAGGRVFFGAPRLSHASVASIVRPVDMGRRPLDMARGAVAWRDFTAPLPFEDLRAATIARVNGDDAPASKLEAAHRAFDAAGQGEKGAVGLLADLGLPADDARRVARLARLLRGGERVTDHETGEDGLTGKPRHDIGDVMQPRVAQLRVFACDVARLFGVSTSALAKLLRCARPVTARPAKVTGEWCPVCGAALNPRSDRCPDCRAFVF